MTAYVAVNNPTAAIHNDRDCRELSKAVSVRPADPDDEPKRERCDRCCRTSKWESLTPTDPEPIFTDGGTYPTPPGDVRVSIDAAGIYTELRECPFCRLSFDAGTRWGDHWPACDGNDLAPLSVVSVDG